MAEGTSNTVANKMAGDSLPSAQIDDVSIVLSRIDDECLYDYVVLDPPAGASATNVNVGYVPLEDGPIILGDAGARQVTVNPCKVIRSATDNTNVRRMLSAIAQAATVVAMPA